MADIEKAIKGLEDLRENMARKNMWYLYKVCCDAIELLKEQQKEIDEIADEYIDIGKEMAKQPQIVRCKDCRYGHHVVETVNGEMTTYCIFCTKPYIERGNATHEPDWYCADGRKRTD